MNNTVRTHETIPAPLAEARELQLPSREAMLQRIPSVEHFWQENAQLLQGAWKAWEENETHSPFHLDSSLINARLRKAIDDAWLDPSKEGNIKGLWEEVSDGVFQTQFFDPERLKDLRTYFDSVADAGIPIRPPYGIALNRYGAMLDPRSEGYLAAPTFQAFYRELMDRYMRPVARLLFPETFGFDSQTFGFSIRYEAGVDTSLQPHTDASAATLNINMNLPGESFTGSEVDFYNRTTEEVNRLVFKPGTAMIHRGNVPHAARPITSGSRSNMVLWLYGENMQIPSPSVKAKAIDAEKRWVLSSKKLDTKAPF